VKEMAEEKPNVFWSKIEKLLSHYKEFWFFLAGLMLGYLLHAIA